MFEQLSHEQRMLLLKFVCAFAWTDLQIQPGERKFVERLMDRMQLGPEARAEAQQYLHVAPSPQDTRPELVPPEHRRIFLDAVRALIYADGSVDEEERSHFEKLARALGAD